MLTINIKKSWFYSAGDKYKWDEKYDIKGIGVSMKILNTQKALEIVVDGERFYLETPPAVEFIKKFNSIYNANGTEIGILSKSLLRKLG